MSFQVSVTEGATFILRWIEERSAAGAASWYRVWQKVLRSLRERADKFGVAPESDDHPEVIFQVVFKTRRGRPYRALFAIRDSEVFVLHVRGPGQNLLGKGEVRQPD